MQCSHLMCSLRVLLIKTRSTVIRGFPIKKARLREAGKWRRGDTA